MREPDLSTAEAFAQWQQDTWGFFIYLDPGELPQGHIVGAIDWMSVNWGMSNQRHIENTRAVIVGRLSFEEYRELLMPHQGLAAAFDHDLQACPWIRHFNVYKALAE